MSGNTSDNGFCKSPPHVPSVSAVFYKLYSFTGDVLQLNHSFVALEKFSRFFFYT